MLLIQILGIEEILPSFYRRENSGKGKLRAFSWASYIIIYTRAFPR
jgi:hypothetical protein